MRDSLSDNGKWGTWQPASGDETDAVVSLLNVSTGKIDQLPLDADQTAFPVTMLLAPCRPVRTYKAGKQNLSPVISQSLSP